MDDDLSICLGVEGHALCGKLFTQCEEVFYNPVMHDDDFTRGADMRVCISSARRPMRRPASMTDPDITVHWIFFQQRTQTFELSSIATDLDFAIIDHRQTRRIVTTIFQSLQALEDNRRRITRTDVSDDATHGSPPHFNWGYLYATTLCFVRTVTDTAFDAGPSKVLGKVRVVAHPEGFR